MRNERNVKKVLLVEDELDINLVFKTVLEYSGFEVDAFNDPVLALQNFVTNSYDLLLLEIVMPKMNGFHLYQMIRKIDAKIKICFITACEMYNEQVRKEVFPQFADIKDKSCFFIKKPIENQDLIEQLDKIINPT